MVSNFVIRIIQVTLISIVLVTLSVSYYEYYIIGNSDFSELSTEYDLRIQVGRPIVAINRAQGDTTLLVSATDDLKLVQTKDISNEVYGDTIAEGVNNSYLNNFDEIVVTDNETGKNKVYYSSLNEDVKKIIYSYPIKVVSSYEENGIYHSLTNISLEATLGYKTNSSIITRIEDGKRVDIYIDRSIDQFVYDQKKDKYYMLYIAGNSNHSLDFIAKVNFITASKNEEGDYVVDYTLRDAGFNASHGNIVGVSRVIDNKFIIAYNKNYHYGEVSKSEYSMATFSVESEKVIRRKVIAQKEIDDNSKISHLETVLSKDHMYVFYDDLSYLKINIFDESSSSQLLTNTGKVREIQFSTDGKDIFALTLNRDGFTLFEIYDGVIESTKTATRQSLGLGNEFFDFNELHDFEIKPLVEESVE